MAGFDPTDFNRWLRQRRAIRVARSGGSDFRWEDFYDDYGDPIEHDPGRYRVALRAIKVGIGVAAVTVVVVVVSLMRGDGAAEPDQTTTTAAVTTTTVPATTTTVDVETARVFELFQNTPDQVRDSLIGLATQSPRHYLDRLIDESQDHIDSISTQSPGYVGPEIDIGQLIGITALVDGIGVDQAFNNTTFNCTDTDPLVVCATSVLPMPEGEVMIVAVEHAAPIPTASTERSYIYSIVFDSDGEAANDWRFNPPFDWDLFQGADRWYQAIYTHQSNNWVVGVVQVGNDMTTVAQPSAARAVIIDRWVIWFIPSDELPAFPGRLRVTSFAHDGAFSPATRGADVIGNDPTEPLIGFDPAG